MMEVGSPFPEFSLKDQDGQPVTSGDIAGRRAVFYFYPKDDTSGCTVEACEFRDSFPSFEGVAVIGVSPDGAASHRRFADKYELPFTLLADPEHRLCEAVGVWVEKSMYGNRYMGVQRTTFLVDARGFVERVWEKVKPQGHAAEVQAALRG